MEALKTCSREMGLYKRRPATFLYHRFISARIEKSCIITFDFRLWKILIKHHECFKNLLLGIRIAFNECGERWSIIDSVVWHRARQTLVLIFKRLKTPSYCPDGPRSCYCSHVPDVNSEAKYGRLSERCECQKQMKNMKLWKIVDTVFYAQNTFLLHRIYLKYIWNKNLAKFKWKLILPIFNFNNEKPRYLSLLQRE